MDEQNYHPNILRLNLSELLEEVTGRTAPPDLSAASSADASEELNAQLKGLQSQFEHLRLAVKYLMFDLDATRRENATLKKLLNEHVDDMLDEDFV